MPEIRSNPSRRTAAPGWAHEAHANENALSLLRLQERNYIQYAMKGFLGETDSLPFSFSQLRPWLLWQGALTTTAVWNNVYFERVAACHIKVD